MKLEFVEVHAILRCGGRLVVAAVMGESAVAIYPGVQPKRGGCFLLERRSVCFVAGDVYDAMPYDQQRCSVDAYARSPNRSVRKAFRSFECEDCGWEYQSQEFLV